MQMWKMWKKWIAVSLLNQVCARLLITSLGFRQQPFNNWMDGAKEDLVDMFIVHTKEEIQVAYNHLFSPARCRFHDSTFS